MAPGSTCRCPRRTTSRSTRWRSTSLRAICAFVAASLAFLPATQGSGAEPATAPVYKYASLAQTPPMGWNSWNAFGCNISEALIRETADAMVKSGMRDAGYTYVNVDDCWHGERDAQGAIQPNAARFPSGMKALADYVHSK